LTHPLAVYTCLHPFTTLHTRLYSPTCVPNVEWSLSTVFELIYPDPRVFGRSGHTALSQVIHLLDSQSVYVARLFVDLVLCDGNEILQHYNVLERDARREASGRTYGGRRKSHHSELTPVSLARTSEVWTVWPCWESMSRTLAGWDVREGGGG
jgi:hypothetical protein